MDHNSLYRTNKCIECAKRSGQSYVYWITAGECEILSGKDSNTTILQFTNEEDLSMCEEVSKGEKISLSPRFKYEIIERDGKRYVSDKLLALFLIYGIGHGISLSSIDRSY